MVQTVGPCVPYLTLCLCASLKGEFGRRVPRPVSPPGWLIITLPLLRYSIIFSLLFYSVCPTPSVERERLAPRALDGIQGVASRVYLLLTGKQRTGGGREGDV